MRQGGYILLVLAASVMALQNIGCGGASREVVPVKGRLVFEDGTPLPAGTVVILDPMEGRVESASGETAADGSFQLRHVRGKAGAEVGKYRVRLGPPKNDPNTFSQQVPDSYLEGGELFLEVTPGMGEVTLKVKRRHAPPG
ncbi:MAG: carboxypeptidase-like regulatory domain-containing protein [Gemmatales bacterium]|nr:hypothetical protein [Gemmatales bacterium]MCS7159660.1 hypothetical protein [Gemmatales bacterium]MDW8174858.1 carboxypeptidase-like regulatory domain-containing protein [Gemmatales bacterium]MDW8224012.1 carboxypeptidase-like regulatory domain-containing protein [Gemmatales bacterium]